jgi:hypothetical protein
MENLKLLVEKYNHKKEQEKLYVGAMVYAPNVLKQYLKTKKAKKKILKEILETIKNN